MRVFVVATSLGTVSVAVHHCIELAARQHHCRIPWQASQCHLSSSFVLASIISLYVYRGLKPLCAPNLGPSVGGPENTDQHPTRSFLTTLGIPNLLVFREIC
jgi:hypothetical protein